MQKSAATPAAAKKVRTRRPVRELVVEAAVNLIETAGVVTLTLEAVAAAAGVSKGGLLHYFRSKEALLTEVIRHHVERHEAEWLRVAAAVGDAGQREADLIAGYLRRSFTGVALTYLSARALFGIAAFNPGLLQPVRDYFRRRANFVRKQPHARAILSFMLMADGLSLFDALGAPPVEGTLREQVHDFAQRLAVTALTMDASGPAPRAVKRRLRDS
jgi:AcrR family transcriptional regulator